MTCHISIPAPFHGYLDSAIVRFESRHAGIRVVLGEAGVDLEGEQAADPELRADFLHTLYREKIYAETAKRNLEVSKMRNSRQAI